MVCTRLTPETHVLVYFHLKCIASNCQSALPVVTSGLSAKLRLRSSVYNVVLTKNPKSANISGK